MELAFADWFDIAEAEVESEEGLLEGYGFSLQRKAIDMLVLLFLHLGKIIQVQNWSAWTSVDSKITWVKVLHPKIA